MENIKSVDVIEVSDKLLQLQITAKKADVLICELMDGYFGKSEGDTAIDKQRIIHDFKRMSVYSEMVSDYILKLKKGIDEAAALQASIVDKIKIQ